MLTKTSRCHIYRHHSFRGLLINTHLDIRRYLTKSAENRLLGYSKKRQLSAFLTPEIQALFWYRVSHFLFVNRFSILANVIYQLNHLIYKVNIPPASCIGPGCRMSHPAGILFDASAGRKLTLFSLAVCCPEYSAKSGQLSKSPVLGNHVQLGAYTVTQGSIFVRDNTKVFPVLALKQETPKHSLVITKRPIIQASHPKQD